VMRSGATDPALLAHPDAAGEARQQAAHHGARSTVAALIRVALDQPERQLHHDGGPLPLAPTAAHRLLSYPR